MDTEREKLTWLRRTLAERYSEQELRTLCFDLGVGYDDLPCEGKAGKARELVKHLANRGRVSELLEIGKVARPDIPWDDVPEGLAPPIKVTSLNQLQPGVASLPGKPRVRVVFGLFVTFVVLLVISTANLDVPTVRELVSRLLSGPAPTEAAMLVPTSTTAPLSTETPSLMPTVTSTSSAIPIPTRTATPESTSTPMPAATGTPKPTGVSPSPTLECKPIGGAIEPFICVAGVSVQINEGAPRPVTYEERLTLRDGDALRLVNLRYCTSHEAPTDSVAGEAYFFKDGVQSYEDNGLFTRSGPRVCKDCGDVGDFEGNWVVEPGQHRVVIALLHYFSDTVMVNDHLSGTYEVDERFYINLEVEP